MSKITKRKYVEQEVLEFVVPSDNQKIVKLTAGRGNNLHAVIDAEGKEFLVSMPTKFRKNIWVKRGDYVIIEPIEEGDKVQGEIVRVLFQEHVRHIQEQGLWPAAFGVEERKSSQYVSDDLLPPSDSDDDELSSTKVVNANRGCHLYEQSDDEDDDEDDDEEEEDGEEEGDVEDQYGAEESVMTEQTEQQSAINSEEVSSQS